MKCIWKSREGGNSLVSDPLLIVSAQCCFRLIQFFPPTQLPFPWYLIQIQALNSQAGKARQYNKESLLFPSSHGCQSQPCLYLQCAALSSVSILYKHSLGFLTPFYSSHLLSAPPCFFFLWSNSLQGELPYPHTNPASLGLFLKATPEKLTFSLQCTLGLAQGRQKRSCIPETSCLNSEPGVPR